MECVCVVKYNLLVIDTATSFKICNAVFTNIRLKYSNVLTIACYVSECSRSWSEFHDLPPPLLAPNMRQVYVQDTQVQLQKHVSSNLKLCKGGLPQLRGIPPSRMPGAFKCPGCGKSYWYKKTMLRHLRLECGKEPQFQCPYCPHRAKQKNHLVKHIASRHKDAV